jgi:hypothetical protein
MVEVLCMRGNPEQKDPCIDGMVGLFINHYGALEPARELCREFQPENQEFCEKAVEARAGMFAS